MEHGTRLTAPSARCLSLSPWLRSRALPLRERLCWKVP